MTRGRRVSAPKPATIRRALERIASDQPHRLAQATYDYLVRERLAVYRDPLQGWSLTIKGQAWRAGNFDVEMCES